jgi:Holliday junction resolvase RusA-like endonuclease
MHWRERENQVAMWHMAMIGAGIRRKRPATPFRKAAVTVTYYFGDRKRRDPDNYTPKLLMDPLTKEGIIADDDFDHVILTVKKGGVDKHNPRVVITIEEVAEYEPDEQNHVSGM